MCLTDFTVNAISQYWEVVNSFFFTPDLIKRHARNIKASNQICVVPALLTKLRLSTCQERLQSDVPAQHTANYMVLPHAMEKQYQEFYQP